MSIAEIQDVPKNNPIILSGPPGAGISKKGGHGC